MNKTLTAALAVSLSAALLLSACGDKSATAGHGGGVRPAAEAEHGHGHGAGGEKITHFTDHTELFVEFPRLVVGEKSAFAAHLTRLADFRALTTGKVRVVLSGGGQPDEAFAVDAPSQPGIFRPEALPRQAGERELVIEVATPEFTVRHELGPVTVFADRKTADAASGEHDDEGIGFTKEQQWKVDFATAEVTKRLLRPAVAATGVLRARPDGEALLTAPAPGQVQPAGKFPQLGQVVRKGDLLAESEAVRLVSPSGASFHVDGIEQGFDIVTGKNGRLIAVGGAVDAATRSVPVLFEFEKPDARLRVGMATKAQVFIDRPREAVAIPAAAVLDENGIAMVFVMTGGESFERRPVRLGARDGDWVEVVEGVEPGQRVVSRGAYLVKLAATNTGQIGHGHAH